MFKNHLQILNQIYCVSYKKYYKTTLLLFISKLTLLFEICINGYKELFIYE